MAQNATNPARVQAAGLGKCQLLAGVDVPSSTGITASAQGEKPRMSRADRDRLLDIKREAIIDLSTTAAIHCHLLSESLAVRSDLAAIEHGRHAIEHARAVAKLLNDLRETRIAGGLDGGH